MDISYTIDKDTIKNEVYRITGYTGSKNGDTDKISSTPDDSDIIESYLSEALSLIGDMITNNGYIKDDKVNLSLPSNWNDNIKDQLGKEINQCIINYICMKWFVLLKKEESEYYANLCKDKSNAIIRHLCERKRPKRT